MKKLAVFFTVTMSIGLVFIPSCGKKDSTDTSPISVSVERPPIKVVPVPNHGVKKIDLGILDSFAVMAYTSISSSPTSNIVGKVGLKPGTRTFINLNSTTEVKGGPTEIYAGDDIGDSADYLNFARANLISAYKEAASREADKDKIEAYAGNPGDKILPPGIYKWSNGVSITSDITLEGNSTDVYIFQIEGDMDIASNVRVVLSGGVRAKNIYWQVSGKTTLGAYCVIQGNIMTQISLEMKNLAHLNGRALVKNGKLIMTQSTINKPEL